MINMKALEALLATQDITPRIERLDLYGELEYMQGSGQVAKDWPPKAKEGEQPLAIGVCEEGLPVAVFIPRD